LASAAIPVLYPNVEIDGRRLKDGALADRTTVERAVELGADEMYVLTTGSSCELTEPPRTAMAMGLHAYNLLEEQRLEAAVARVRRGVRLHVIPPLCPVNVLPVDFSQTGHLIRRAANATAYGLKHGTPMPAVSRELGELHAVTEAS